jgi:hypothetical protein
MQSANSPFLPAQNTGEKTKSAIGNGKIAMQLQNSPVPV